MTAHLIRSMRLHSGMKCSRAPQLKIESFRILSQPWRWHAELEIRSWNGLNARSWPGKRSFEFVSLAKGRNRPEADVDHE